MESIRDREAEVEEQAEQQKLEFYDKSFLTVPEQLEKLVVEKGLVVGDEDEALRTLRAVGYYRLSGYWHFFRDPQNSQKLLPGTTMEKVHELYQFDQQLKSKIAEGLQAFEVAFRFHVGHTLGRGSTFAHLDLNHLDYAWTKANETTHPFLGRTSWLQSEHARFQAHVLNSERVSGETFVEHFRNKYALPHLPTWVVTEILTFGNLIALYNGSRQEIQQRIATSAGFVDANGVARIGDFRSVLDHLRYVRNIWAHHARLWNQSLTVKLPKMHWSAELSHLTSWKEGGKPRVYDTLVLLAYLMGQINPASTWRAEILELTRRRLQELQIPLARMGFPEGWESQPIWGKHHVPSNETLHRALSVLEHFSNVYSVDEAGSLFRLKGGSTTDPAEDSSKEKKARVSWARKKGALVCVRTGSFLNIPSFQIDEESQVLAQSVADLNVQIFAHNGLDPAEDSSHLEVARWWFTPNAGMAGQKPLSMLNFGGTNLAGPSLTITGA